MLVAKFADCPAVTINRNATRTRSDVSDAMACAKNGISRESWMKNVSQKNRFCLSIKQSGNKEEQLLFYEASVDHYNNNEKNQFNITDVCRKTVNDETESFNYFKCVILYQFPLQNVNPSLTKNTFAAPKDGRYSFTTTILVQRAEWVQTLQVGVLRPMPKAAIYAQRVWSGKPETVDEADISIGPCKYSKHKTK